MEPSDRTRAVSIGEAARRLGKTPDAVRGLIRRGTLTAIRGNDGRRLVLLPEDLATVAPDRAAEAPDRSQRARRTAPTVAPDRDDRLSLAILGELRDALARARDRRDRALAEAERARREAEDLRLELARVTVERDAAKAVAAAEVAAVRQAAEERIAARNAVIEETREALADLRTRLDRAEAELRKPWWRRLWG